MTVVRLDRPERRNAPTPAGLDPLGTAVEEASAPVVALEGTGEAFCAGANLDAVAGLVSRVVNDPRTAAEIADNDPDAVRVLKARFRDDTDRETADRREAGAFATLWDAFEGLS